MSAAEKKYNETLLKTIDEFKEKYGVTIDKYLLHGTISYKYLTGSLEGLYDSNSGITDNDFTSSLESLKNEQESEEEEKTGIEYSEATKKIAVVAALMISKNSDGSYSTDAKRGGIFYNNLVQSSFLESYYADFLKDNTEETKKKLVDDIFDYAELAREMLVLNTIKNVNVVSNNISVYLQSCKPSYNYKTISGVKVFDNKLVNEGTEYPLYLSLRDYVKGNIMGEVGVSLDPKLKEYIKTQAVLGLSFMLADSRTGFNLKTGEIYYPTQTCRQVTCDPTYGCISVEGVASYSWLYRNYSGIKIKPLTEEQNAYLDEILDEVFGVVIAKPGVTADTFSGTSDVIAVNYCSSLYGVCPSCHAGTCVGQNQAKKDSQNGMTYDQIIAKYITGKDYELVNISEGLYYETTKNYEGQIELNENFYYNQGKYSNTTICSGEGSLRTYGCSVVSTAISVSLLTGEKHDPIEINSKLKSTGSCGGSASRYNNMINGAELYNLKTYKVNKGDKTKIDQMLSDLSSGNSVVTARIAPNAGQGARYSTKNGHYIVLVGTKTVDGRTKVLVWDPGNTSSSRHNYWADFEQDIEKWVNTGPSYVVMSR